MAIPNQDLTMENFEIFIQGVLSGNDEAQKNNLMKIMQKFVKKDSQNLILLLQENLQKIEDLETENAELNSQLKNLKNENEILKIRNENQSIPFENTMKIPPMMMMNYDEFDEYDEYDNPWQSKTEDFFKPMNISAELEAVIGLKIAPKNRVINIVWAYIKANRLQIPDHMELAICDEKLMKVIGEPRFRCFDMARYLEKHMY